VPDSFHIDMDFNETLLDSQRAIPILKDLQAYPQVQIFETPIPQRDIKGNRAIRRATRVAIAMHFGDPPLAAGLKHDLCHGFVISGGASRVVQQGAAAAMADKPFWLQLVGTGITAAFALQLAAVLSHARWPAVTCHQLYAHSLLAQPIVVREGLAGVPEGPGLGYDIDWRAVDRFRVDKPPRRPDPPRLIETSWPDRRKMYIANTGRVNFMLDLARQGQTPYFQRGAATRLVPNDGGDRWRRLYEQARREPLLVKE
jgi:galactonate dehydratase